MTTRFLKDSWVPRECSANAWVESSARDGVTTTLRQPGEHAWKGLTAIFSVGTTLSRFDCFLALTFQQHCQQSALRQGGS